MKSLISKKVRSIPFIDPIKWLECQNLFPKIYWKERSGNTTYAAVGELLSLQEIPDFRCEDYSDLRFFGGLSFFPEKQHSIWSNFPTCRFILPEFILKVTKDETQLIQYGNRELPKEIIPRNVALCSKIERTDLPSKDHWIEKITALLQKIENKELEKVVMGRKSTLHLDRSLSPYSILPLLPKDGHTVFSYQLSEEEAFLGSSPEKLYERNDREIASDALAGTRPKGKTQEEEEKFRQELVESDKEQREFAFVKDFLFSTLTSKCNILHWQTPSIRSSSTVQHLYQKLIGQLKEGITDRDLIALLHPTPALGGKPKRAALEHLMNEEPFARGWYGAPIGWIEQNSADIAVAIRSCLMQKNTMHLFAAAGIVKGSDPMQEWEEIEHKLSQFLRIFL